MDNQIFAYVDGIPTKGLWIDMDLIDSWDEIKAALVEGGYCTEEYGGDILVADAEGLCRPFAGTYGCFDLAEFVDCRDHDTYAPDEAKIAYVEWMGSWDSRGFEARYVGDYSDESNPALAYAEERIEETGMLDDMPENLRGYFDTKAYACDLELNGDIVEQDGFIFYNN